MATPLTPLFADSASATAKKQLEAGLQFRQPRLEQIKKLEDNLSGKVKPALSGRFNVPLPILKGFLTTALSKVDDPVKGTFGNLHEKDLKPARKLTAAAQYESSPERGNWAEKDLDAKQLAFVGGVTFLKAYGKSRPKWSFEVEWVDYYDMVTEPGGGKYIDKHLFRYQMNIYRTKEELEYGAEIGIYHPGQVKRLVENSGTEEKKQSADSYENKINRFQSLGLDARTNNYVGQELFNLTEGVLTYRGKEWYILFHYETGVWIRFEQLTNVFASGLSPWMMWSPYVDPTTSLPLGPLDDIYPIAELMRIIFNQMADNLQKQNWDMTAYDKKMFPDPSKLKWRPDGLIAAKVPDGKLIGQGIYQFQTPQLGPITIRLIDYLNQFIGEKTGITPGASGNADEKQATIYLGNQQAVQDRFSLVNKLYSSAHTGLYKRFEWAAYEHMPDGYKVQVLGTLAPEWVEINKKDTEPDFKIILESSNVQAAATKVESEKRDKALDRIYGYAKADPRFAASLNPKALLEEELRQGGFSEEKIRVLMDTQNYGNEDLLSEADSAIYDIIYGDEIPKPNRLATTAYIMKIENYAYDHVDDLKKEFGDAMGRKKYDRLIAFANLHWEFAQVNADLAASMANRLAGNKNPELNREEAPPAFLRAPASPGEETITPQ